MPPASAAILLVFFSSTLLATLNNTGAQTDVLPFYFSTMNKIFPLCDEYVDNISPYICSLGLIWGGKTVEWSRGIVISYVSLHKVT